MTHRTAGVAARQRRIEGGPWGVVRHILTNTRLVALLLLSSLFLVAMLGLAIWGPRGFLAMWHKQRNLIQLTQEIDTIERENARLSQQIDRLQHDMSYIEKIAREELGLVRNGELVFKFVDQQRSRRPRGEP